MPTIIQMVALFILWGAFVGVSIVESLMAPSLSTAFRLRPSQSSSSPQSQRSLVSPNGLPLLVPIPPACRLMNKRSISSNRRRLSMVWMNNNEARLGDGTTGITSTAQLNRCLTLNCIDFISEELIVRDRLPVTRTWWQAYTDHYQETMTSSSSAVAAVATSSPLNEAQQAQPVRPSKRGSLDVETLISSLVASPTGVDRVKVLVQIGPEAQARGQARSSIPSSASMNDMTAQFMVAVERITLAERLAEAQAVLCREMLVHLPLVLCESAEAVDCAVKTIEQGDRAAFRSKRPLVSAAVGNPYKNVVKRFSRLSMFITNFALDNIRSRLTVRGEVDALALLNRYIATLRQDTAVTRILDEQAPAYSLQNRYDDLYYYVGSPRKLIEVLMLNGLKEQRQSDERRDAGDDEDDSIFKLPFSSNNDRSKQSKVSKQSSMMSYPFVTGSVSSSDGVSSSNSDSAGASKRIDSIWLAQQLIDERAKVGEMFGTALKELMTTSSTTSTSSSSSSSSSSTSSSSGNDVSTMTTAFKLCSDARQKQVKARERADARTDGIDNERDVDTVTVGPSVGLMLNKHRDLSINEGRLYWQGVVVGDIAEALADAGNTELFNSIQSIQVLKYPSAQSINNTSNGIDNNNNTAGSSVGRMPGSGGSSSSPSSLLEDSGENVRVGWQAPDVDPDTVKAGSQSARKRAPVAVLDPPGSGRMLPPDDDRDTWYSNGRGKRNGKGSDNNNDKDANVDDIEVRNPIDWGDADLGDIQEFIKLLHLQADVNDGHRDTVLDIGGKRARGGVRIRLAGVKTEDGIKLMRLEALDGGSNILLQKWVDYAQGLRLIDVVSVSSNARSTSDSGSPNEDRGYDDGDAESLSASIFDPFGQGVTMM
jgi:hypothetical protein